MNITDDVALVVVDFQGGDLVEGAYPVKAADTARKLVATCREAGIPVVWIQEVHKPHLADIGRELDGSEGPHCIEGAPATELLTGLGPVDGEFLVQKRRYSSFFATELDIVLRDYEVDSLLLIGGFTDICVLYTAVDAHQRDFRINVLSDVVAGSSDQAHDDALMMIDQLQDRVVVGSDEAFAWLRARAEA